MPDVRGLRRIGTELVHCSHCTPYTLEAVADRRIVENGLLCVFEGFASAVGEGRQPLWRSLHKIDQRRVVYKVLHDGGGTNLQMREAPAARELVLLGPLGLSQ